MSPLLYRSKAAAAKYSTQQFQRQTAACMTCKWSLWEANDVCVVGGRDASQFCMFVAVPPAASTAGHVAENGKNSVFETS